MTHRFDCSEELAEIEDIRDSAVFDPLQVERLAPLTDQEADRIDELCQAASPGPLVIDDEAEGDGIVVATLPDGRHLIDMAVGDAPNEHRRHFAANAKLFSRARCYLLRLLRDRQDCQRQRQQLLERIAALESVLDRSVDRQSNPPRVPTKPR